MPKYGAGIIVGWIGVEFDAENNDDAHDKILKFMTSIEGQTINDFKIVTFDWDHSVDVEEI